MTPMSSHFSTSASSKQTELGFKNSQSAVLNESKPGESILANQRRIKLVAALSLWDSQHRSPVTFAPPDSRLAHDMTTNLYLCLFLPPMERVICSVVLLG